MPSNKKPGADSQSSATYSDYTGTTEDSIYLEDSFLSQIPELSKGQRQMLAIFMLLEILSTFLTVSLTPLYAQISQFYSVSPQKVHLLNLITVLACLLAFYPTNAIISKFGVRTGLFYCLVGAVLGAGLCCLINNNYNAFLLGYFLMQFFLQGIHAAKGNFVNLYYSEKNVREFFDFLLAGVGVFYD